MLNKIFIFILLLIAITSLSAALATSVFAGDYGLMGTAGPIYSNETREIPALIGTAVTAVFSLLLIVFFGVMMYAGLRWMTAKGNDELADKAKHALQAGVIGIIIVVSAYAITNFVLIKLPAGLGG